ncbi:TadE/TadG family type IV pilus assembly protein [Mesorhizobium sp. CN5-321]|jgi:Flp pilus assembly protein TadG|uniref:TadE/TadG family type IV pilus assembly protein n=1 Tax=Mesorhizobium hunchu TaxID=3157708 RepID=UPI0032B7D0EF
MSGLKKGFLKSRDGSFAPALAVAMVPLVAAVGMVSDYSRGTAERTSMQSALDAASLSIMTMSKDTAKADRQKALQAAYVLNGGNGTATLGDFDITADGTSTMTSSASYAMPTDFMSMAGINTVAISVAAAARKNPALVEAAFKINKVSGYWNKTMTLYGVEFGETDPKPLMQITYEYNGNGGSKGYGTTTVYTPNKNGKLKTVQQQQKCTSASSWDSVPAGSFVDGNRLVTCTFTKGDGTGATIDVSQMNTMYLEMNVPSGNPKLLKTNDPATSDRLYIDGVESPANKTVDIFSAVPCGNTSTQAWEDGGNAVPAPVSNADFFYDVTGKCNFSQRPSEVALTR